MKILFSARPAYGHVYPLMPLAIAARRAGHEVAFATAGHFVTSLRALGFRAHEAGPTLEEGRDALLASLSADELPRESGGRPDMRIGGALFIDVIARRTAADLAPLLPVLGPDLVVYEQYDLGAAVAAHVAGITAVCHSVSPRMPDEVLSLMARDHLPQLWADHGRSPGAFDVFTGDAYLDLFPGVLQQPSFLDHPSRWAMRPVPFADPGATLPAWIGEGRRPLVYLTLGTVVSTDEVLRPVVDGLGALDADVLLALGSADGAALGRLPANLRVERFVDQPAVLRHADFAVHHGGSGTLLGCLLHRTPQLVLPKGADQFFNADLVRRAGLAPVLEPAEVTPESVAATAAAELAGPRPGLDAVHAELAAMAGPDAVLEDLVRLVELRGTSAA